MGLGLWDGRSEASGLRACRFVGLGLQGGGERSNSPPRRMEVGLGFRV